jgi:hypothetical protein
MPRGRKSNAAKAEEAERAAKAARREEYRAKRRQKNLEAARRSREKRDERMKEALATIDTLRAERNRLAVFVTRMRTVLSILDECKQNDEGGPVNPLVCTVRTCMRDYLSDVDTPPAAKEAEKA